MKLLLTLTLPFPPSLNTYYRHVGAKVLISKKGREYREAVGWIALVGRARLQLKGRLAIEIDAYPPDRRARDIDNLQKACLDAMQKAMVYENDSQIDRLVVQRMPVAPGGSMTVRIYEAEEAPS